MSYLSSYYKKYLYKKTEIIRTANLGSFNFLKIKKKSETKIFLQKSNLISDISMQRKSYYSKFKVFRFFFDKSVILMFSLKKLLPEQKSAYF